MALRFLCLHGYGQNAEVFRSRIGPLRRAMKALVSEFVFVDAPHQCTHFLPDEEGDLNQRLGWWDWVDEPDGTRNRFGWDVSEAALTSFLQADSQGFDGILGFSQGAVAGAILCAKQPQRFKMAVLVAGGLPTDAHMRQMLERACAGNTGLPKTLHVYGTVDQLVPPQKILDLVALWGSPASSYGHSGGHMVPSSKEFRNTVTDFILAASGGSSQSTWCENAHSSTPLEFDELRACILQFLQKI